MNLFQRIEWRIYKELKRLRLKNSNATIISSNCNGEFIYYDMKLPFLSPTINLSFDMNDYVKCLKIFDGIWNSLFIHVKIKDLTFQRECWGILRFVLIIMRHSSKL